jgi:hypothetical protein
MSMSGSTKQIVTAYEVGNLSPEQIVETFDGEYDITAVKAVLASFSSRYRKDYRLGDDETKKRLGFTEEQEASACEVIAGQIFSEDEHVAQRAAIFIREDRQGRRDPISKMANLGLNIIQFNQAILAANESLKLQLADRASITERRERPIGAGKQRVIDIESVKAE